MAVTVTVSISGTVAGDPSGTKTISATITNGSSTVETTVYSFTGAQFVTIGGTPGANNIPIPTGAIGFVLVPPTNNANTITIKGVTGDTGWVAQAQQPSIITIASGQTMGILCNTTTVLTLQWF